MASVAVSLLAQRDESYIFSDLAGKAGVRVAAKYRIRFQSLYQRLRAYPDLGAPRPRISKHLRIGVISPYVIAYRYDPATDVVTILRIVHGRRKLTPAMLA